jgi:ABC-2 type transport system permease protein
MICRSNTLVGIYAVWWREFIVFLRETPRAVSAIISPIIWLVVFGAGLGSSVSIPGTDYQSFIFAGILVQTFLFSSLFYGAYLVWDKKVDLLKAILVSPLSRRAIFMGKILGGVTISLINVIIVLVIGFFLGINLTPTAAVLTFLAVAFASIGLTAMGLMVGSMMESPEGFQLLSTLVLFPMFFLSGALFPISNLSGPLATIASVNPVTYIVDILRGILTGTSYFGLMHSAFALLIFTAVAMAAGIFAFERMKA